MIITIIFLTSFVFSTLQNKKPMILPLQNKFSLGLKKIKMNTQNDILHANVTFK